MLTRAPELQQRPASPDMALPDTPHRMLPSPQPEEQAVSLRQPTPQLTEQTDQPEPEPSRTFEFSEPEILSADTGTDEGNIFFSHFTVNKLTFSFTKWFTNKIFTDSHPYKLYSDVSMYLRVKV